MKLIIAGSTGFVATEIIRQALARPEVTSVIALARRETPAPPNLSSAADTSKLRSVVCSDFEKYPDHVKEELAGADACIWTIAVTVSQFKNLPWDDVRKICCGFTLVGLDTLAQLPRDPGQKPLRFIYISGSNAERDQRKKPLIMGRYCLMRGDIETRILESAKASSNMVEACIVKPGLIDAEGRTGLFKGIARAIMCTLIRLPRINVDQIAAALLDHAINGFDKDTLTNDEMASHGQELLSRRQKL